MTVIRRRVIDAVLLCALLCAPGSGAAQRAAAPSSSAERSALVQRWIDASLESWLVIYRRLHQHPELSRQERATAALVARELRKAGYRVMTGIGGHGVAGVLSNGDGRTLLLRGDMDALPVAEQTGLPYQSRVQAENERGERVPVMHACGHDVHVTNLLATAAFLAHHRALWSGTLVIIAQPAEELGEGASAMLAAGLFDRVPRPDYALALHVDPDLPAGRVAANAGWAAANVDSVDVTLFGRGGHGARPHVANDPVVTAAHFVTALQTLVSRRNDPQQPAVVTVGSIHGGTKGNVIPDAVHMQLTVRSYGDETRALLLSGIEQLARDVCAAFRCPKAPTVSIKQNYTPAVYNDPELTATALRVLASALGEQAIGSVAPTMGGEDFGRYGRALGIPSLLFRLGATPESVFQASRKPGAPPPPSLHSGKFAPDAPVALRTGVRATASLVMALLSAPEPSARP